MKHSRPRHKPKDAPQKEIDWNAWDEGIKTLKMLASAVSPPGRRLIKKSGRIYPREAALERLRAGDPEPFFHVLAVWPDFLREEEVWKLTIARWWPQKVLRTPEGHQARAYLKRIGRVLADTHGTTEMPPEEREAIVASCKTWRPVCEQLNEIFKRLWKQGEYHSSESSRKTARGRLAKKLDIPIAEVEAIEWFLKKPSRRANKSAPSAAMCHRVARDFPGRGEKTIEKVWGDYLKDHPEESRKRRSIRVKV